MSRYKNAGQNKNFAKGYPFVGYTVTNKQPLQYEFSERSGGK